MIVSWPKGPKHEGEKAGDGAALNCRALITIAPNFVKAFYNNWPDECQGFEAK